MKKRTNFELILMLIALISWVLLFIKDWQLGLLIFFIIWGNNLQTKKL